METRKVVIIAGEGIGPEIMDAALWVLPALRGAIEAHDRSTPDLGGEGTTDDFASTIVEHLC